MKKQNEGMFVNLAGLILDDVSSLLLEEHKPHLKKILSTIMNTLENPSKFFIF